METDEKRVALAAEAIWSEHHYSFEEPNKGFLAKAHPDDVERAFRQARAVIEALTRTNNDVSGLVEAIAHEAKVANDVIALKRDADGQGRIKVATAMHRIAQLAERALAKHRQSNGGSNDR